MRHLLVGLTLTVTLAASGESGWLEPADPQPWSWLAVVAGLTTVLGILLRASGPLRSFVMRHRASLALVLHGAGYAVILYPLGWVRFCLDDLAWRAQPLPSIGLLLVPAVVLAAALTVAGGTGCRGLVASMRITTVFGCVFLLAVGLVHGLERWDATARLMDLHAHVAFVAATLGLVALFAFAPLLTLLAVPTCRLPESPLRDRLLEIARQRGLRLLDVRIWSDEEGASLNACAIGIVPGTQLVLLSPGLVRLLKPREIAAVFAHEIAHLARRHILGYLLLVSGLFLWIGAFEAEVRPLSPALTAVVILAVVSVFLLLVFGPVSRRFELEADAVGAEIVGHGEYAAVLLRMILVLSEVARRDGWRHYSTKRRLDTILELGARPEARGPLDRNLRRIRGGIGILLVSGVAVFAWGSVHFVAAGRIDALVTAAEDSVSAAESLREGLETRRSHTCWLARDPQAVEAHSARLLGRSAVYLDEARALVAEDEPEYAQRIEKLSEYALRLRAASASPPWPPPVTP